MPSKKSAFHRDVEALKQAYGQAFIPDMDPSERGEALDELIEVARRLRWRLVQITPGLEPGRGRPASAKRNRGIKLFSLFLPEKSTTALLEAGITSREQLIQLSIEELREIPNLGRVGVGCIRRGLLDVGIRLPIMRRAA